MKRRGGDGGRTMVLETEDAERMMIGARSTEMEDLCSKLMALVPQDYKLDNSQGLPDLPSQLMQATTYIKDLRGRVEMLKQRRDDSYAKILQVTIKCSRSNVSNDVAPGSTGAAHSDVNLTMNSNKCIEFHKVIHAIEQDRCLEIVRASSCMVEGGKIVYTIECRARSSEVVFDAPMVEKRLRRLFTEWHANSERFGA